jgi:hypothetical protein
VTAFEEATTYALLVGTAIDAVAAAPSRLRSPLRVTLAGIGTPPVAVDGIWCRTWTTDGFVIAADATVIGLDAPSSSGPSPKHLAGAFDLHFTLAADGYADLPVTVSCNHDHVPLRPAPYVLAPHPFALRGRVAVGTVAPAPLAGATVTLTGSVPAVALPAATVTDADGTYVFVAIPAVRSLTIVAAGSGHSGTQTIEPSYPDPLVTTNFALT